METTETKQELTPELTQESFDVVNALLKESLSNNESMKAKMDALLSETKKAKNSKRETEENARVAEEETARKQGNFEQLHLSGEKRLVELQEKHDGLLNGIANDKCKMEALRIASSLADGDNVSLLLPFILPRLKYIDGSVKILDNEGLLTVSTAEELKTEIQTTGRFAVLLKGNQSTGGGASGGSSGSATNKIMTRSEFDKLDPLKRMTFMKSGGKTIDN